MPDTNIKAAAAIDKTSSKDKAAMKAMKKQAKKEKKEKRKHSSDDAADKEDSSKAEEAEKEKPAKKSKSDSKDKKDTSQKPVAAAAASAVTIEQAKEFYEKHNISVTGDDSFMPFLDFKQAPFGHELMSACSKFSKPTPIQSACWPVVTAARDVIGIAETGSGKTYAFALPAIHFLKE
ncbi:RNA-dependent ATPase, partial [Kickxella alabastrina]